LSEGEAISLPEIAEILAASGKDLAAKLPVDCWQVTVSHVLSPRSPATQRRRTD
jgi:hypothetical protein